MTESYEAKARKWLKELKGRTLVWYPRDAIIAFARFLDSEKAKEEKPLKCNHQGCAVAGYCLEAKQEKKECCDRKYPHEHLPNGGVDITQSELAQDLGKILDELPPEKPKVKVVCSRLDCPCILGGECPNAKRAEKPEGCGPTAPCNGTPHTCKPVEKCEHGPNVFCNKCANPNGRKDRLAKPVKRIEPVEELGDIGCLCRCREYGGSCPHKIRRLCGCRDCSIESKLNEVIRKQKEIINALNEKHGTNE